MKRHSAAEISSKVREIESLIEGGRSQAQACKEVGVSVMTFHRWRKQQGSRPAVIMEFTPARAEPATNGELVLKDLDPDRIAELRLENERLRRIVTDLLLEKMKIEEQVSLREHSPEKHLRGR